MMTKLTQYICERLCGRRGISGKHPAPLGEVPQEVRDVSHDIANSAARIEGSAHIIKREAEFMLDWVKRIQEGKDGRNQHQ